MSKKPPHTTCAKAQDTLHDPAYINANAIKSLNNYEKILVQQAQAEKTLRQRSRRVSANSDRGVLRVLFSTIH